MPATGHSLQVRPRRPALLLTAERVARWKIRTRAARAAGRATSTSSGSLSSSPSGIVTGVVTLGSGAKVPGFLAQGAAVAPNMVG